MRHPNFEFVKRDFFNLSNPEKAILLSALEKFDSEKFVDKPLEISLNDISKYCDKNYEIQELFDSAKSLAMRYITIPVVTKNQNNHMMMTARWIERFAVSENTGHIFIGLPRHIIALIESEGIKEFLAICSQYLNWPLKSYYATQLYEILIESRQPSLSLSVTKFRTQLLIESTYERTTDVIKYIIKPAIKEINDKMPIKIDFQTIKAGKTITDFAFSITPNEINPTEINKPKSVMLQDGRDPDTADLFNEYGLTDSDRLQLAKEMCSTSQLQKFRKIRESDDVFIKRIANEIIDEPSLKKFADLAKIDLENCLKD